MYMKFLKSRVERSHAWPFAYLGVIVVMFLTVLSWTSVHAMPPHPDLASAVERGDIQKPYFMKEMAVLHSRGINSPRPVNPVFGKVNAPAWGGETKILAILVDFSDQNASVATEFIDTLIYGAASGSVNHYYREVSYDDLNITSPTKPSSLGWVRLPQTLAYYANNQSGSGTYPQNCQKMVEDAIDAVDSYVDFSQYDNDVDGLIVVHSGSGTEYSGSSEDIWSQQWSITPRLKDGVYISAFATVPEYWVTGGDMTIGVFCHELGHIFGLPDLYDADNSSYGVGNWSLMSNGCWNGTDGDSPAHPDAWSRVQLAFCSVDTISTDANSVNIPAVEIAPVVFRLWSNGVGGDEYFLVENRRQTGYDAALPGQGLLVYHIDESKLNNNSEWYPTFTDYGHFLVALEQADGLFHTEKLVNPGDGADPFPGSTSNVLFGASTAPSSDNYGLSPTAVVIANISSSADTMTADFEVQSSFVADDENAGIQPGVVALSANFPNPFNANCQIKFNLPVSGKANLTIFNVKGDLIRNLADSYFRAGVHQVAWDGRDNAGNQTASGCYFYSLKTSGSQLARKMVYIK